MDFRFTPDQEAFRKEFISWLDGYLATAGQISKFRMAGAGEEWAEAYRHFQKGLSDAGYAGLHYPKAYGGQGKTLGEEVIVQQTVAERCVELRGPGVITFGMAAPTIFMCGTE